ncbi:hypothetical protein Ancab_006501 [Ancistrocladus abbreviatus]
MEPWNPMKDAVIDVPEGVIIPREHTALNNLFSCLWFNEAHPFTPRDQLSFGYVVYRLKAVSITRPLCCTPAHESIPKVEWVKSLDEFKKNSDLKESRGGLELWTPHPADLDKVVLPPVVRTSKAG